MPNIDKEENSSTKQKSEVNLDKPKKKSLSQWQLIWRDFKKHKLAMIGLSILVALYLGAIMADFISPYNPRARFRGYSNMSPQRVRLFSEDGFEGPFVYGVEQERDPRTLGMVYTENKDEIHPIKFFVNYGEAYSVLGLFETNLRLFAAEEVPVLLFGTDSLGRDLFGRTLHGARLSLSIGLIGVFLSFIIGITLGGISGYYGGVIDDIIQRIIEFVMSIPDIPLWMSLSAALPSHWTIVQVYFAITIILSIRGWTGMARTIRGQIYSLRELEFVKAARSFGASDSRIVFRHLIPNCISYILVSLTLAIPGMILGETALSFLGLGLSDPAISWGVLLMDAQNVRALADYPWLFFPAVFVVITVLAFNFVGDGLRDAADPYH